MRSFQCKLCVCVLRIPEYMYVACALEHLFFQVCWLCLQNTYWVFISLSFSMVPLLIFNSIVILYAFSKSFLFCWIFFSLFCYHLYIFCYCYCSCCCCLHVQRVLYRSTTNIATKHFVSSNDISQWTRLDLKLIIIKYLCIWHAEHIYWLNII